MNIEITKTVNGKFQSKISKTFPLTGSGSASEVIKPITLLPWNILNQIMEFDKRIKVLEMEETICSSLESKIGKSNVNSCSVTTSKQQRSTLVLAQLNADVSIQANDKSTAIDELVRISNEVMEEVPELAQDIKNSKSTPSDSSTQEDVSETLGSIDAGGSSSNDTSSTTFLSFGAALFLMQIII